MSWNTLRKVILPLFSPYLCFKHWRSAHQPEEWLGALSLHGAPLILSFSIFVVSIGGPQLWGRFSCNFSLGCYVNRWYPADKKINLPKSQYSRSKPQYIQYTFLIRVRCLCLWWRLENEVTSQGSCNGVSSIIGTAIGGNMYHFVESGSDYEPTGGLFQIA